MERQNATVVIDEALNKEIREMLEELGHPPLVARIFPKGWENEPREKRLSLHALCIRTFSARAQPTTAPQRQERTND